MQLPAHFSYHQDQLYCEEIALGQLAQRFGTPLYVYSAAHLRTRATALSRGVPADALVCYAVKANQNLHILRLLGEIGLGADVTSAGELALALRAGISPQRIVYSGAGKSANEIRQALQAGIHALHVESDAELTRIAEIARTLGVVARIAVRINPQVPTATHPYIRTGTLQYKFGVPAEQGARMLRRAQAESSLEPVGIAAHIGSQISEIEPFLQSTALLVELAHTLRAEGIALEYLDAGGGLGISYEQAAPAPLEWAQAIGGLVAQAGLKLLLEPGRSIVGGAGVLLTEVQYNKSNPQKEFVIVDAGMTHLLRPTLYQAHHPIVPVAQTGAPEKIVDIVGPICESGDYLARERALPAVQAGDLLAVLYAGAYGFAMSNNYNGQMRPAEVLVEGANVRQIRRRETLDDLLITTL